MEKVKLKCRVVLYESSNIPNHFLVGKFKEEHCSIMLTSIETLKDRSIICQLEFLLKEPKDTESIFLIFDGDKFFGLGKLI